MNSDDAVFITCCLVFGLFTFVDILDMVEKRLFRNKGE